MKTILVVDDDQETLNLLSRTLAAGGFDVLWARDGVDALDLLARTDRPIDLIVTDVVLPWLSGPEFVDHLTQKLSKVRVVYVSAYDTETVRGHGVDPDADAFLAKPYEPADLVNIVRTTLTDR
jgi:two-component system, cell cycle sensor histidine kinase and response regulator CckA